jgi:hypothetical protein
MQLHQFVKKSGHHLRFAKAHRVVECFEIHEVSAIDACSFPEDGMCYGLPATLLRAILDII